MERGASTGHLQIRVDDLSPDRAGLGPIGGFVPHDHREARREGEAVEAEQGLATIRRHGKVNRQVEPVAAAEQKAESWGPVSADTDQPYTMQQMAQAWKRITKPIPEDDIRLSVDPDDYPLF